MTSKETKNSKWKTCKSRRETAVQGTNDSSIVSKCSMASVGYFDDPFLQQFVSKTTRRAPLINRGYYIRAKTIDYILRAFLNENGNRKQIMSLGAGFDSAYFRLKSAGLLENTTFYEVDYPEVVKRKCDVIKSKEFLHKLIPGFHNQAEKVNPLVEINTDGYKLLGSDLSQLNTLEALLNLCKVDFDIPTLLLSECVLTYMTRRCSTAVVKWASETFPNSVFVLYEQINPSDAFGLFMQNHFQVIGSPLKCINAFPSIESQKERFTNAGWQKCEALDMNQFYHYLVTPEEKNTIETIEPFDEYEEWHLKCAHYMVICGYNGSCRNLIKDSDLQTLSGHRNPSLTVENVQISSQVQRFGHSSTAICDDKFIASFGGFGESNGKHRRMTEISVTSIKTFETNSITFDSTKLEISRMHNQVCCLSDGTVYVIGGRTSPVSLCTQLLKVEFLFQKNPAQSETEQEEFSPHCPTSSNSRSHNKDVSSEKDSKASTDSGCHGDRSSSEFQVPQVLQRINDTGTDKDPEGSVVSSEVTVSCPNCNKETSTVSETESKLFMESKHSDENITSEHDKENLTKCQNNSRHSNTSSDGEMLKRKGTDDLICTGVNCVVVKQCGDIPCPRWRHTATVIQRCGKEMISVYGGRTDKQLALDDCYLLDVDSSTWEMVPKGTINPGKRHSHAVSVRNDSLYVTGGLDEDLRPKDTIYRLCLQTLVWSVCKIKGELLPRYSHTSLVIDDLLVLIGGVTTTGSPPGVAVIDLVSMKAMEFPLPAAEKKNLLMLHRHTSHYLGEGRILVIGGGGNCFSFGTHLNSTPVILNITECVKTFKMNSRSNEEMLI